MSLTEFYQQADPIFFAISITVVLGLFLMAVIIILINILHLILPRKLDPLLFNERWFSVGELGFYSTWPLSLMRTGIYMTLVSFPNYVKNRRFKGLDINIPVTKPLVIFSMIYFIINVIIIFLGFSFLLLFLYIFIEAEFF